MATWKTVTVGPAKTYASLQAAMAAEYTNLTGETGDLVIECYDFEDTTLVNTTGQSWTTDATHRIIIRAADDHAGKWSTSSYRMVNTATAIQFRDAVGIEDILFEGIQMRQAQVGTTTYQFQQDTGATRGSWQFDKCIFIYEHADAEAVAAGSKFLDGSATFKFRNCLMYGPGSATSLTMFHFDASTVPVWIDGCTFDGFDYAVICDTPNLRMRDTRVTDCTGVLDTAGTYTTLHSDSNYNLTDGTAPTNWGANSIDSGDTPTIDYVDDTNATYTSRDYHLDSVSDSGYDAGVSLAGDGDNPFSDDIDGDTRSRWDIGADEYNSGGAVDGGSAPMISVFATAIQRAATW